jgi:N-acetylglucosamine-6-phosphate deacetylase
MITDAMAAAGASDGDYGLGSLAVEVRNGVAHVAGTDTIAGSTLTLDHALRFAIEQVGVEPVDAVTALTFTPARVLGLERGHGLLAPGFAADAIQLDSYWRVQHVWANGRRVS